MNRQEADELCDRYAAEHPDRKTHRWIARGDDEAGWSVVKIGLPPIAENKLVAEVGGDKASAHEDRPAPQPVQGPYLGA